MSEATRQCLGCKVTDEEIERLKLTQRFDSLFILDDGSQQYLCTKCQDDPRVLAHVIAEKMALWSSSGPRGCSAVAGLFSTRDEVSARRTVETMKSLDMNTRLQMQAFEEKLHTALDHHHSAIDECRQVLGLDALKKNGSNRQKLGAFGAIAGALLGWALMSSKRPMETLRYALYGAKKILENAGIHIPDEPPTDAPSPEDAPLS